MNEIAVFKPVETFEDPTISGYNRNRSIVPYDSMYWQETVKKFHVKLPSHVIDMTEGFSTCTSCGQRYAGCQEICNKIRMGFSCNEYSPNSYTHPGDAMKGDYVKVDGRGQLVWSHGYGECNRRCKWDLEEEFYEQRQFFSFLNTLTSLPEEDNSDYRKYESSFPLGLMPILEKRMMELKIQVLEMQNQQILEALKQIAQKMNQAGAALSFGF